MPSRRKKIKILSAAIDLEDIIEMYDLKDGETKMMTDGKDMTFITLKNGVITIATVAKNGILTKKKKIDKYKVWIGGENDGGQI